jgi:hypothetical protein
MGGWFFLRQIAVKGGHETALSAEVTGIILRKISFGLFISWPDPVFSHEFSDPLLVRVIAA